MENVKKQGNKLAHILRQKTSSEDITLLEKDTPTALANAIIIILDEGRSVKESTVMEISKQLNKEVITQRFCDTYRNVIDREAKKHGTQ